MTAASPLRGEVWQYDAVSARMSGPRLIVSSDAINRNTRMSEVLTLPLAADDPGSLLSPRIGDHGWVDPMDIIGTQKHRLTSRLGVASAEEMTAVGRSLRIALAIPPEA